MFIFANNYEEYQNSNTVLLMKDAGIEFKTI